MVKFTIEQIRHLMDYKDNIRNMSGKPYFLAERYFDASSVRLSSCWIRELTRGAVLSCSDRSRRPR